MCRGNLRQNRGPEPYPGAAKDEKPAHKNARRSYLRKTKRMLGEAVHANGKALTDEERAAIHAGVERHPVASR